jgi:hypothetical protein
MRIAKNMTGAAVLSVTLLIPAMLGQALSPELKAKVDAKAKEIQAWSTDAQIVAAVKANNANPPAEAKAMTNDKWKGLTILDPFVRSFSKNALGQYLKAKKNDEIAECFVSGADGTKVAFLSKTSSWSHADKPKHKVPMSGKTWVGPMEVDESTGQQEVQVAVPVLDGAKPIGSIVVGLSVAKLR